MSLRGVSLSRFVHVVPYQQASVLFSRLLLQLIHLARQPAGPHHDSTFTCRNSHNLLTTWTQSGTLLPLDASAMQQQHYARATAAAINSNASQTVQHNQQWN